MAARTDRWRARTIIALVLVLLGVIAIAKPSQAAEPAMSVTAVQGISPMGKGTCIGPVCIRGSVGLTSSSDASICTYRNWSGNHGVGSCYRIYPGQRTPASVDTDGFRSHPTCKTYIVLGPLSNLMAKNSWQKVNDAQRATVKVVC